MTFSDGTVGTVSVLDIEEQINALLTNPELMQEKNLAQGLDVFTGVETGVSDKFGEIHTGGKHGLVLLHITSKMGPVTCRSVSSFLVTSHTSTHTVH